MWQTRYKERRRTRRALGTTFLTWIMRQTQLLYQRKKESNPHSPSTERKQDREVDNPKKSVLGKLYMHGYMNVNAEPMTFDEVRKLAKQLDIPDFNVME